MERRLALDFLNDEGVKAFFLGFNSCFRARQKCYHTVNHTHPYKNLPFYILCFSSHGGGWLRFLFSKDLGLQPGQEVWETCVKLSLPGKTTVCLECVKLP